MHVAHVTIDVVVYQKKPRDMLLNMAFSRSQPSTLQVLTNTKVAAHRTH